MACTYRSQATFTVCILGPHPDSVLALRLPCSEGQYTVEPPPPPESLTTPRAAAFSLIGLSKSPMPCPCVFICTVISFSTCPLYPVSVFLLVMSLFFHQPLAGWPSHGPYTPTPLSCEWNATLSLLLATGPNPSCFSLLGKCPGLAPARTATYPLSHCHHPWVWSAGRPLLCYPHVQLICTNANPLSTAPFSSLLPHPLTVTWDVGDTLYDGLAS